MTVIKNNKIRHIDLLTKFGIGRHSREDYSTGNSVKIIITEEMVMVIRKQLEEMDGFVDWAVVECVESPKKEIYDNKLLVRLITNFVEMSEEVVY